MSKKRTSEESNNSIGAPPPSTSDDAKRAKLVSLSDTTLQDLPIELLKCILVKAIAMEVMHMKVVKTERKENAALVIDRLSNVCFQWSNILSTSTFQTQLNRILDVTQLEDLPIELFECILVKAVTTEVWELKLAKSVWREKADVALSRLGSVCPLWSSFLKSDLFRKELHRVLDRTTQRAIRMEILHQHSTVVDVRQVAVLGQEIFLLYGAGYVNVYEYNDLTNIKEMICLDIAWPAYMTACSVANCLYLVYSQGDYFRVRRVTRNDKNQFVQSTTIPDTWLPNCIPTIAITTDGHMVVQQYKNGLPVLYVYSGDGTFVKKITFATGIPKYSKSYLVSKPNGNLVLISISSEMRPSLTITEIDLDGTVVRQRDSLSPSFTTCQTDDCGRLLLSDFKDQHQLVDDEFNLLEFDSAQMDGDRVIVPQLLHHNSDRNEVVTVGRNILTISRLTEV